MSSVLPQPATGPASSGTAAMAADSEASTGRGGGSGGSITAGGWKSSSGGVLQPPDSSRRPSAAADRAAAASAAAAGVQRQPMVAFEEEMHSWALQVRCLAAPRVYCDMATVAMQSLCWACNQAVRWQTWGCATWLLAACRF